MAVLYRTNAQSRAVEDSLRAAGIAYVVLGGVGFYERKEIKDALSYLKLILNPHDDIALRRVINVPARGIGKGVMDALEAGRSSSAGRRDLPPLLAGLQPTVVANSLWSKLVTAVDERRLHAAASGVARGVPRSARRRWPTWPARIGVDRCSARCSTSPATSATCARTRSEESEGRIENLMELVSAAQRIRGARSRALAGRLRRSPVAAVGRRQGAGERDARVLMMTLHSAKGLEFPVGGAAPASRKACSRTRGREKTKRSSKRSGACCYVGITRARKRLVLTSAARRRVFGEYQAPSRRDSSTRFPRI